MIYIFIFVYIYIYIYIYIYYVLCIGNNCVTKENKFYRNGTMMNNKGILFIYCYLFIDILQQKHHNQYVLLDC